MEEFEHFLLKKTQPGIFDALMVKQLDVYHI